MLKFKRKVRVAVKDMLNVKINKPKALQEFAAGITKRNPQLKFIYGWINPKPMDRLEALAIFSFNSDTRQAAPSSSAGMQVASQMQPMTKYVFFPLNLFGTTCLESMKLCEKEGTLDDYFDEVISQPMVYPENVFREMLRAEDTNLSSTKILIDPRTGERTLNPKFWKNPENADKLVEMIDKFSASYFSLNPNKKGE